MCCLWNVQSQKYPGTIFTAVLLLNKKCWLKKPQLTLYPTLPPISTYSSIIIVSGSWPWTIKYDSVEARGIDCIVIVGDESMELRFHVVLWILRYGNLGTQISDILYHETNIGRYKIVTYNLSESQTPWVLKVMQAISLGHGNKKKRYPKKYLCNVVYCTVDDIRHCTPV